MELYGLKWMLDRLNEIVGGYRDKSPQQDDSYEYAVTSLRRALNETEIYYGTWREENQRDRQREEGLSRTWLEVARELRSVDPELSKRCELKARYWADPVGWSPDELMDLKITIQEMHEALDKLLGDQDRH